MTKLKATVLFDYDADAPDEHTLKVGDVLTNVKHIEEGWCKGVLNGKPGMFPDNFVKIEEDKTVPLKPAAVKPKKAEKRLMKATFMYDPANVDELKLEVGDIVEILHDEEEGWAKGRLKNKEGVFPTNFCVPYNESEPPPLSPKEQSNGEIIVPKKVKGVGFGNIFSDGQVKLKKTLSSNESELTDKGTVSQTTSKPRTQIGAKEKKTEKVHTSTAANKKPKGLEKCRVSFDYQAQTTDELTLFKGDIITILNKNCNDPGWWEGEIVDGSGKKRRGMFPDNFVVILPSVDDETDRTQKLSKANVDMKIELEKHKPKQNIQENNESKAKNVINDSKLSNIGKRPAPQLPPPVSGKPHSDAIETEIDGIIETSDEKKLTHYKRPVGPKNRRKPDAANRRERAKESAEQESSEEDLDEEDEEEIENEQDEQNVEHKPPPSLVAAKRKTIGGIQVIPTSTAPATAGDGGGGDTPNWLQQLKSRNSTKRESAPLSVAPKSEDSQSETPDWLANLRKNPKSADGTPATTPNRPPQPSLPFSKPMSHFQSLRSPPAQPMRPDSPVKHVPDENSKFKPPMLAQKSKSEANVLANQSQEQQIETKVEKPPEVKKPPSRPPVALQPPSLPVEKKPSAVGSKPKPPPAKAKPALPTSKPASSSAAVDEMKEDVKSLREMFSKMQADFKKEVSRLSDELDREKKHRIAMQAEVSQLLKRV